MEVSELSHINKPFSLFLSSWPGTTIDNLWLLFLCLIMTNLFSIKAVFRTNRKRQRDDVFSLFSTTRQVSVLTTLDNLSLRGHGVLGKVLHCRLGSIPALLIYVFPPTGLRLFEQNGASPNATTINQVKVAKRLILRHIWRHSKRPRVRGFKSRGIFVCPLQEFEHEEESILQWDWRERISSANVAKTNCKLRKFAL